MTDQRLRGHAPTWIVLALLFTLPAPAVTQGDVEELGRALGGAKPPPEYYEILRSDPTAFRFSRDNGWILRGQSVAAFRNARRGAAATSQVLLSPVADFNGNGIMRGELNVPAFLILFSNTDSAALATNVPRESLETRLYGTDPAPPYSIHTYYREISSDSLRVNGTVLDWTWVSQPDTYYEAGCNGLCARVQFVNMVTELVQAHDDAVDFGQFDNDGPDGVPNSGDDDGYVDVVVLMHPEVDGSCKNVNPASTDNIWAHRWVLQTAVTTGDPSSAPNVAAIQLRDYIIQGGQGGDTGCTDNEPQAMGVVAHETGHVFGLPDLYDTRTSGGGQGIGHWGLMGSGNWNKPFSPAHMEAWSRAQLGWVTEVVLTADTVLEITPIATSDTAYVLPLRDTDEYFLLENRQRIGSDAQLHGAGLLIWHVDSSLVMSRWPFNQVNSVFPYGVALEQADGRTDLEATSNGNRGDLGDPFPGSAVNRSFGVYTTPSTESNSGAVSFLSVDSIAYVPASQNIRFQVHFRQFTVVMASDTMATFQLDGTPYNVFSGLLDDGTEHQLEMDSVQVVNDGGNRYTWLSWSNGQPRSHTFTASSAGDTIVADVAAEYVLQVETRGPGGSVASAPAVDFANGEFVAKDSLVELVASVGQSGHIFEGWSGDTTSTADTLELTMVRPFRLVATFAAPLVIADVDPDAAVMGAAYQYQLQATGGTDTQSWTVLSGSLPQGVTLSTGGELSGVPEETGTFAFTGGVTSGSQAGSQSYQLVVSAPALAVADVVAHVTGTAETLTDDEVTYLDLLGNENGVIDVGDFFAWVEATGASPGAGALAAVVRGGREEIP